MVQVRNLRLEEMPNLPVTAGTRDQVPCAHIPVLQPHLRCKVLEGVVHVPQELEEFEEAYSIL